MGVDAQMLVKTRANLSPDAVRKLAGDLAEAFGADSFWIWDDWKNDDGSIGRHALQIVEEYTQDGDSLFPVKGEQFIEVNIATRYYGEGYERGDIGLIINVAAWLEARIPDARIFYGGDSSGICAEPFDAKEQSRVFAYFARVGHSPYRAGWGGIFDKDSNAHSCGFCQRPMISTGGGSDRTFFWCSGCDKKAIFHLGTRQTQIVPKGKDFFDMRETAIP